MRQIAFTGPSSPVQLWESQQGHITRVLKEFSPTEDKLITGACVGVDAYVAYIGHTLGFQVHTIVPYDRHKVDPEWEKHCQTADLMPPGSTYRDRNIAMVDSCDLLVAFLYSPEFYRSGEWLTLNVARHRNKPIRREIFT